MTVLEYSRWGPSPPAFWGKPLRQTPAFWLQCFRGDLGECRRSLSSCVSLGRGRDGTPAHAGHRLTCPRPALGGPLYPPGSGSVTFSRHNRLWGRPPALRRPGQGPGDRLEVGRNSGGPGHTHTHTCTHMCTPLPQPSPAPAGPSSGRRAGGPAQPEWLCSWSLRGVLPRGHTPQGCAGSHAECAGPPGAAVPSSPALPSGACSLPGPVCCIN